MDEVSRGALRVGLGRPVMCTTDAERVALALAEAYPTRIERDYAALVALARSGDTWTIDFDMSAYRAALKRI